MCWVMVDTEADGPVPSDYSMVALGAVIVEPSLSRIFRGRLKPVSDKWIPRFLSISGFTREETLEFEEPDLVMSRFGAWINKEAGENSFFISDNNGFDWQFINWYFHHFTGTNPFGFSSTNLRSLNNGLRKNMYTTLHRRPKGHRRPHDPLQDALRNASVLLKMKEKLGLKINW